MMMTTMIRRLMIALCVLLMLPTLCLGGVVKGPLLYVLRSRYKAVTIRLHSAL